MQTLIAGGHGKIALILTGMLKDRGGRVRSLIRNPDHASDVRNAGGDPVVLDLEATTPEELDLVLTDCDAVVFAAGAGPGSSAERKDTVDHMGAVHLIEAAKRVGPRRYVIVSSTGANPDREGDEIFDAYLRGEGPGRPRPGRKRAGLHDRATGRPDRRGGNPPDRRRGRGVTADDPSRRRGRSDRRGTEP